MALDLWKLGAEDRHNAARTSTTNPDLFTVPCAWKVALRDAAKPLLARRVPQLHLKVEVVVSRTHLAGAPNSSKART